MAKQYDLEAKVLEMAENDSQFRDELSKDPKTAIEKKFDITLPKNLKVVVVEDTADTVHLVLPPQIDSAEGAVAWV